MYMGGGGGIIIGGGAIGICIGICIGMPIGAPWQHVGAQEGWHCIGGGGGAQQFVSAHC